MSEESTLNEGEIHDVLRNDRRRAVIEFLNRQNRNATIRELSEHIATVESGEDPPPRNVRQSVYVSLHQTHLPKLEALGIVDYDTDSKDIRIRERAEQIEPYMGPSNGGNEWAEMYAGLGALGVLLAAIALGSGFTAEPVVLPVFAAIAVLAGYQAWLRSG